MGECSESHTLTLINPAHLTSHAGGQGGGSPLSAFPMDSCFPTHQDIHHTLTPVNPAHLISPAGGRGVQPPVSIPNAFLFSHTSGYTPHTHPDLPCPHDIACGGSGGGSHLSAHIFSQVHYTHPGRTLTT